MYRRRLKIVIILDIVTFGGKQWQKKPKKKKRECIAGQGDREC